MLSEVEVLLAPDANMAAHVGHAAQPKEPSKKPGCACSRDVQSQSERKVRVGLIALPNSSEKLSEDRGTGHHALLSLVLDALFREQGGAGPDEGEKLGVPPTVTMPVLQINGEFFDKVCREPCHRLCARSARRPAHDIDATMGKPSQSPQSEGLRVQVPKVVERRSASDPLEINEGDLAPVGDERVPGSEVTVCRYERYRGDSLLRYPNPELPKTLPDACYNLFPLFRRSVTALLPC
jgi:hypothetical protein